MNDTALLPNAPLALKDQVVAVYFAVCWRAAARPGGPARPEQVLGDVHRLENCWHVILYARMSPDPPSRFETKLPAGLRLDESALRAGAALDTRDFAGVRRFTSQAWNLPKNHRQNAADHPATRRSAGPATSRSAGVVVFSGRANAHWPIPAPHPGHLRNDSRARSGSRHGERSAPETPRT